MSAAGRGRGATGPERLPPGRHGLPRDAVLASQRGRLLAGAIATAAARGCEEVTVTEICSAAGVSRRTFYDCFPGKDECLLAAHDEVAEHLLAAMAAAGEEDREWPPRARAQLAAMLAVFAANHDLVRFALVAVPAAGEPLAGRHAELLRRLLALLTEGVEGAQPRRRPEPGTETGLLETLLLIVADGVREEAELEALLPQLTLLFLMPYLGRPRAVRVAGPPQTFSSSQDR